MIANHPEGYLDDDVLYKMYPKHHKWFNKLYIAEKMGYKCGPNGVAPDEDGTYIVRPIVNLSGMGVGAEVKYIKAGDCTQVPAGYFWCEYFGGTHYSASYSFVHDTNPYWKPLSCWEGVNYPSNLSKFTEWKRSSYIPIVPKIFNQLSDVPILNVEFKGDNPIEVHLRDTPNPQYDHLIPVWASDPESKIKQYADRGYKYIAAYSNGDGQLADPRLGFMVR